MKINQVLAQTPRAPIVPDFLLSANVLIQFAGKVIQSTLYYASLAETVGNAATTAVDLGVALYDNISAPWAALLPNTAIVLEFNVMTRDLFFNPLLSTPHSQSVGAAGGGAGNTAGRAQTVNVHFVLDYATGVDVQSVGLPVRSYIQVGPIYETAVNDNAGMNYGVWAGNQWTSFQLALLANMGGQNGETFYPIRISSYDKDTSPSWCQILSSYLPTKVGKRSSRNKG